MARFADVKAAEQLQKIVDFLGEFGGVVETNDPAFWTLAMFVEEAGEQFKRISIGVFEEVYGDSLFDPQFTLLLKMRGDRIARVKIEEYLSESFFAQIVIDGNDMAHITDSINNCIVVEEDEYGLRERFSSFMRNMTEVGPYLTNPASVERFTS